MLVLSRKRDECIVIAGVIRVRVLAIRDGQVKLGIEAPLAVPVHREEVAAAIAAQQTEGL